MFIKRPFPCLRKLLPAYDDHKKIYYRLLLRRSDLCPKICIIVCSLQKTAQLLKNPYLTKEERRYMSKK